MFNRMQRDCLSADQLKKWECVGEPLLLSKCSAAKAYACDVSIWVTNKTMELMGSYGYSFDYNVEKYLRDVKILQLWLGGPQRAFLDVALGYYKFEW
jgi:alkylation response protein AidB-like acyl-CoA dehydrogenase